MEVENALKALLAPHQNPSMQLKSLQRELLRKLQQALRDAEETNKISYNPLANSLSPWDSLPNKRNLEALARAGLIRTLPEEEDEDDTTKRSIANLAKNGQLPNYQINESKREMESAEDRFDNRQEFENILERLYNKRNIQNLARNFDLPVHGKRSLASLIRNGDVQYSGNKNTLSTAQYPGKRLYYENDNENIKRNLASIKAQFSKPVKKDFEDNFEDFSPVYHNNQNLMASYNGFPIEEKRFLGEYKYKNQNIYFLPKLSINC